MAHILIAVAPVPARSGTSLDIVARLGHQFPPTPFNAAVRNAFGAVAPDAEIVTVTEIVGDTFTVLRAQEGTSAHPITTDDVLTLR